MDLRINDKPAIRRVLVLFIVFFVVILCNVKFVKRRNFGHNGVFINAPPHNLFFRFFCDLPLFFVMVKDCRSVLRADVIALSIKGSWVMGMPKYIQQFFKRYDVRIKFNLSSLCMTCSSSTYLLIGWIFYLSS